VYRSTTTLYALLKPPWQNLLLSRWADGYTW